MSHGIGIGIGTPFMANQSGFDPRSFPNLELMLVADYGITIGTGVSQWSDQSGKGNHVTQGTAGQQPTFVSNWQGGRAAIQFDGVNDSLFRTTLASGTIAQPTTMYVVMETAGAGSPAGVVDSRDGANRQLVAESNAFIGHFAGAYVQCARTYVSPEKVIYTGVFNGASSNGRARRNGLSTLTQSGDVTTGSINGITIGNAFNDGASFAGKIAQVLLYRQAHSAATQLQIENGLVGYYRMT